MSVVGAIIWGAIKKARMLLSQLGSRGKGGRELVRGRNRWSSPWSAYTLTLSNDFVIRARAWQNSSTRRPSQSGGYEARGTAARVGQGDRERTVIRRSARPHEGRRLLAARLALQNARGAGQRCEGVVDPRDAIGAAAAATQLGPRASVGEGAARRPASVEAATDE